jgi:hypothetical protein
MPITTTELPDLTGAEKRSLLAKIVEVIEDEGSDSCLCQCPGIELHTTSDNSTDCFASYRPGEVPTISCYHTSCRDAVYQASQEWRSLIGKEKIRQSGWSPDESNSPRGRLLLGGKEIWGGRIVAPKATSSCPPIDSEAVDSSLIRRQQIDRIAAVKAKAAAMLPRILEEHRWSVEEMMERSPGKIPEEIDVALEWRRFLSLWRHDDGIWVGEVEDSGELNKHAFHFKAAEEWARYVGPPTDCHFTSAVSFLPGTFARNQASVKRVPFLVVEGDKLAEDTKENEARCGAIIRWLSRRLELKMVVRTGGRSLHGWFTHPGPEAIAKLKPILLGLGMDERLSTVSQPCRLPGRPRPGKDAFQRICWFHLNHAWSFDKDRN